MTTVNKIGVFGDAGTGKSTTTGNMIRHWLLQHDGQTSLGPPDPFGWHTGAGGFQFKVVSPLQKAAMEKLGELKFPKKTLPSAVGREGEFTSFAWRGQEWELHCFPGERVFTPKNGINVPTMVQELRDFQAVILCFSAPLLSVELGCKFVYGLTEEYQRPTLRYGLADAVANAVELSLGLSRAGLAKRYPREVRTLREHDASTTTWNADRRGFDTRVIHREKPVTTTVVDDAVTAIVAGEHTRRLGSLLVRNVLPRIHDRVIIALTHVDLAEQFLGRVIGADDWAKAFGWLWQGIDVGSAQKVLVGNTRLELLPDVRRQPEPPAGPPAADELGPDAEPAKPKRKGSRRRAIANIIDLDLSGAAKLWSSVHHLIADRERRKPRLIDRVRRAMNGTGTY